MEYFYLILASVFIFNFIILIRRRSKSRDARKSATEARIKAERNLEDTKRRLSREQEKAEQYVRSQNKMLEMYEMARQNGKTDVDEECDFQEPQDSSRHDTDD